MRNLVITTILTAGLILPGVSLAAHPFGVDTDSLRNDVVHNIENPSYTTEDLSIKTKAQELQGEQRGVRSTNFNVANYFFGVNLANEDIS